MEKVKVNHPLSTEKYTYLEHEKEVNFNAPHHFVVKRASDGEVVTKVDFQEGPIQESGVNGVANEDLLTMVLMRLEGFQGSPYACLENQKAMEHIMEGLFWLRHRTNKREKRGVEGTHTV